VRNKNHEVAAPKNNEKGSFLGWAGTKDRQSLTMTKIGLARGREINARLNCEALTFSSQPGFPKRWSSWNGKQQDTLLALFSQAQGQKGPGQKN